MLKATITRFKYSSFLVFILILGFLLRVWNIDWGLPYLYYADEVGVVGTVQTMMRSGDLNPHFFHYPSFHFYVLLSVFRLGEFINPQADLAYMYLLGRGISLFFGVASILVIYLSGKELYDEKIGLVSAFFLAIVPIHTVSSRYATTDIHLTFWVSMAILFSAYILTRRDLKFYLLAGIASGLAASTKYTGFIVIVAPIAAHVFRTLKIGTGSEILGLFQLKELIKKPWLLIDRRIFILFIFLIAFFLAASPYILLDYPTFKEHFYTTVILPMTDYRGADTLSPWVHYGTLNFVEYIIPGTGTMLAFLSLFWILYSLFRRKYAYLLPVIFIITFYFGLEKSPKKIDTARYVLPLIPLICLAGATFILKPLRKVIENFVRGRNFGKRVGYMVILLSIFFVSVGPIFDSYNYAKTANPDTRTIGKEWVENNIEIGAFIAREGGDNYNIPLNALNYPLGDFDPASWITFWDIQWFATHNINYFVLSSLNSGKAIEYSYVPAFKTHYMWLTKYLPDQIEKGNVKLIKDIKPAYKSYLFNNPRIQIYLINSSVHFFHWMIPQKIEGPSYQKLQENVWETSGVTIKEFPDNTTVWVPTLSDRWGYIIYKVDFPYDSISVLLKNNAYTFAETGFVKVSCSNDHSTWHIIANLTGTASDVGMRNIDVCAGKKVVYIKAELKGRGTTDAHFVRSTASSFGIIAALRYP